MTIVRVGADSWLACRFCGGLTTGGPYRQIQTPAESLPIRCNGDTEHLWAVQVAIYTVVEVEHRQSETIDVAVKQADGSVTVFEVARAR